MDIFRVLLVLLILWYSSTIGFPPCEGTRLLERLGLAVLLIVCSFLGGCRFGVAPLETEAGAEAFLVLVRFC